MRGSLLITFDEALDNRNADFLSVTVNGQVRKILPVDTVNQYTTFLNIGDAVNIRFSPNPYITGSTKNLSLSRVDYTTDDTAGDFGIKTTHIQTVTGTTYYVDLPFTASTRPDAYTYHYVVTAGSILNEYMTIGTAFTGTTLPGGGLVSDIEVDNNGRYVVVGRFTNYNGTNVPPICRILYDGTLDTSFNYDNSGADYIYQANDAYIQDDNKIVFIGLEVGGFKVKRLNVNGSIDTTFPEINIGGGGSFNEERLTRQSTGKIIVGTDEQNLQIGGKRNLWRFNLDGTVDTTFNSAGVGFPQFSQVFDVEVLSDDKILVTGRFEYYNGVKCNGVLKLNSDGSIDTSFTLDPTMYTGSTQYVWAYEIQYDPYNDKIYVGCDTVGNVSRYLNNRVGGLFRLNSDGTLDTSYPMLSITGNNYYVNDVYPNGDGKVYISGQFISYSGQSYYSLCRLNEDGTLDTTFATGTKFPINSAVLDIEKSIDGNIVVGGNFGAYNSQSGSRFFKLKTDGTSLIV